VRRQSRREQRRWALSFSLSLPEKQVEWGTGDMVDCCLRGADMSKLPDPDIAGKLSVEQTLHRRRSCRSYKPEPLDAKQVSQILWSGQGITLTSRGFRTAPSAGATFPLVLYPVIPEGVHRYDPMAHSLTEIIGDDVRRPLAGACLEQYWMTSAGLIVVIACNFSRTTGRYGRRGERYVWMEVGHAAENMFLQAEALGLGSVAIGAFDDQAVADVVRLPKNEHPALLVVVGVPGGAD